MIEKKATSKLKFRCWSIFDFVEMSGWKELNQKLNEAPMLGSMGSWFTRSYRTRSK
jgi:hypothetical protein